MENNCNIPDLVQAFSYVEKGGLNLVSLSGKDKSIFSAKTVCCLFHNSLNILVTRKDEY